MMALLAFLTTLNFVVYSSVAIEKRAAATASTGSSQNNAFPDEKVPDNPNSFSEEFLHEPEELVALTLTTATDFPDMNSSSLLSRTAAFVSPPPDRC